MLLAVEGGGFFSSSASGYSKGLMLLLLGRSKDERPMRVAPWNLYQLVEQEGDLAHQLATKKRISNRGCAPFMCFHRASPGVDRPLPPKVGPVNNSETLQESSSSSACDQSSACSAEHLVDKSDRNPCMKSSLKTSLTGCSTITIEGDCASNSMEEDGDNTVTCTARRKVQWTDSCGRELVQIREFEPSDDDTSDDDFERDFRNHCKCVIQ